MHRIARETASQPRRGFALSTTSSGACIALDETARPPADAGRRPSACTARRPAPHPDRGAATHPRSHLPSSPVPDGFIPSPTAASSHPLASHDRPGCRVGPAEAPALGSLVLEGTDVRLTGEDTRRGTFSQRHALLVDYHTGWAFSPLASLDENQGKFWVYDSLLSEYAAVGFEYGYSVVHKDALVAWEAQFGDFVNGAQIIIDQFLVAAEDKWLQRRPRQLLLHGWGGTGALSARIGAPHDVPVNLRRTRRRLRSTYTSRTQVRRESAPRSLHAEVVAARSTRRGSPSGRSRVLDGRRRSDRGVASSSAPVAPRHDARDELRSCCGRMSSSTLPRANHRHLAPLRERVRWSGCKRSRNRPRGSCTTAARSESGYKVHQVCRAESGSPGPLGVIHTKHQRPTESPSPACRAARQANGKPTTASRSARACCGPSTLIVVIPIARAGFRLIPRSSRNTQASGFTSSSSQAIS